MSINKTTAVIGASLKEERYSNMAIRLLRQYNHEVLAIGPREGNIGDVQILKQLDTHEEIHTVTLYIGLRHQHAYYDTIINLAPQRVIFNPGTENEELMHKLEQKGIEVVQDCTLVMLNSGIY
jgi:predicted CoA-binding protein